MIKSGRENMCMMYIHLMHNTISDQQVIRSESPFFKRNTLKRLNKEALIYQGEM